ncbi:IS630 family transposase (plasmid) [Polaromonas hydrogenivorans]|uniref:IS630 family transposase n=2 Tax=Polaromonas hydrogenivorans TaxID=335476 RepID=A0AAU7LPI2_9BURK
MPIRWHKPNSKKNFVQEVAATLPPSIAPEQVDVWFQDEMRIGQRGTQTRLWARKGTRPRVVRQQQSESAYIFGAVCAQRDTAVGLILPQANTEAMTLHLQAISEAVPAGRHAVLVLDRAGWHTTAKLPQFSNLSLLPLPAGSPELNPAEQVWQQLRDRHLANRCYDGYEQIVDACCDAWNAFTQIPGAIRSLCSRSWAVLPSASVIS